MMRTFIVIALLLSGLSSTICAQSDNPRNLGLMSELIYVKNISENYMVMFLSDSTQSKEARQNTIVNYNEIKLQYDQIIMTLEQEMFLKNSFKVYQKLDKAIRNQTADSINPYTLKDKNLRLYAIKLNAAYRTFKNGIYKKCSFNPNATPAGGGAMLCASYFMKLVPCSAGEIVALGSVINAAIKNANDMKEKKVNKIASMLDQLRLRSTAELSADLQKKASTHKPAKGKAVGSDAGDGE